jgi:hypothetical protein
MNDFKKLVHNTLYKITTLNDELKNLVRMNILSFSPLTATYRLQRRSMCYALKRYIDSTFIDD